MNDNCYYVAGKSATFSDHRQGSLLENGGLPAWKIHIDGDNGSLETDPALGTDYMPTNTQCTEMGIRSPFILNNTVGIASTTLSNRIAVYPNPTTGELRITNYELRIKDVEIFDMMGRMVETRLIASLQASLQDDTASSLRLDISHLANGIYFLRIGTQTVKVIKN